MSNSPKNSLKIYKKESISKKKGSISEGIKQDQHQIEAKFHTNSKENSNLSTGNSQWANPKCKVILVFQEIIELKFLQTM